MPLFCMPVRAVRNVRPHCWVRQRELARRGFGNDSAAPHEDGNPLPPPPPPALRPYQVRNVASLYDASAQGFNPLYYLPTGGGKTVVLAALAAKWEVRFIGLF